MNAAGATRTLSPAVEERIVEQAAVRPRRVREDARDGLAVIAFSAAASIMLALLFVALTALVA